MKTRISGILSLLVLSVGGYAQAPTVIQETDLVSNGPSIINPNFSNLYTGKASLVDCSGTAGRFVETLNGSTTSACGTLTWGNLSSLSGYPGALTVTSLGLQSGAITGGTAGNAWTLGTGGSPYNAVLSNGASAATELDLIPGSAGTATRFAAYNGPNVANAVGFGLAVSGATASLLTTPAGTYTAVTALNIGESTGGNLMATNFVFNGLTQASISNSGVLTTNGISSSGNIGLTSNSDLLLTTGGGILFGTGASQYILASYGATGVPYLQTTSANNLSFNLFGPASGSFGGAIAFRINNAVGTPDTANTGRIELAVRGTVADLETTTSGTGTGITTLNIGETNGSAMTSVGFQFGGTTKASISNAGLFTAVNATINGLGTGIVHSSSVGVFSSSAVSLTADVSGALPVGNGGTGLTSGTANKVLGGATPSMVTVTSSYVDNSIALTGADINTSNQVTITHLASALPVTQGGLGIATGTSGGVLCFTASTTIASSAALTQHGYVVGGGAGVCPSSLPVTVATLTDGATVTWAIGSAVTADAQLTFTTHGGSRTLNITGPLTTGNYNLRLIQDGTGGEGLTLGSGCTWLVVGGGGGAITPSAGAGAVDVLSFYYDGTNCYASLAKNFT